MHGAHQPHPIVVRAGRRDVPAQREHPVRVFRADGPEHGVRHRSEHIVQRRSVRAKAPGLVDVRPERVLFQRLLLRHHRVRHHRQLEDFVARHHYHAHRQHRGVITGEFSPVSIPRVLLWQHRPLTCNQKVASVFFFLLTF